MRSFFSVFLIADEQKEVRMGWLKGSDWIPLAEVMDRPYQEAVQIFRRHVNPGLATLLEIGEYTALDPIRAEGSYIYCRDGRRVVDFVSSYGALNLGHNHPQVAAAIKSVLDEKRLDLSKEMLSRYTAFLANNLIQLVPGDLDNVYFCNSGTEGVEAALKMAVRYFRGKRQRFVHAANSLHGKTLGALSVTGNSRLTRFFPRFPNYEVPYGDAETMRQTLESAPQEGEGAVAAVVLEPIQGEAGVIVPPAGYLRKVRELCSEFGVLLILDEIQTGMCRTGTFFACDHEQVIPDLLVLAKSLGGGLASIGAVITRKNVFEKAYGSPHECLVQTSTFGGRTIACAAAMAALEVCREERLAERAAHLGEGFINKLRALKERHPQWIDDVRGRGLMIGIEFREDVLDASRFLPLKMAGLREALKEHLPGMVAAALLKHHSILGTLMLNNKLVLRVYPSLTIGEEELDRFVASLDAVLESGPEEIIRKRLLRTLSPSGLRFVASWIKAVNRKD